MTNLTVELPPLHPSQKTVFEADYRFKTLACGRRWGKTRLGSLKCVTIGLCGGRAWWVAPSYPMSNVGWRLIKQLAVVIPGTELRQSERSIIFPGGGSVQIKSADKPDSLRGEGLDYLVMDECAFIKEDAWSEALRPALADRKGGALFISTPKGINWFFRIHNSGADDWHHWSFPTSDNPYIDAAEIETAKTSLPERIFRQEFMAEFIDDAGGVFRNVMQCAIAEPQEAAIDGHSYIMGVDWGKHNDFTVLTILDTTGEIPRQAHTDRFNQIDYTLQVGRLKAVFDRFKPFSIIAERNSMGEPLIEQMARDGLPVQAFTTTNATKGQAIEALALAFERQEIGILNDPVTIGELQAYEMERLPSGMLRYNAAAGMHDDTVMSLALAYHGVYAASPAAAGQTVEVDIDIYKSDRQRSRLWQR